MLQFQDFLNVSIYKSYSAQQEEKSGLFSSIFNIKEVIFTSMSTGMEKHGESIKKWGSKQVGIIG